MSSLYLRRVTAPKSDVIAIYIGFIGSELKLFECNTQNQTLRMFTLEENDPGLPAEALAQAQASRHLAFYQVRVFSHPDYTEYFRLGSAGTKAKKQDFWVRTTSTHFTLPSSRPSRVA